MVIILFEYHHINNNDNILGENCTWSWKNQRNNCVIFLRYILYNHSTAIIIHKVPKDHSEINQCFSTFTFLRTKIIISPTFIHHRVQSREDSKDVSIGYRSRENPLTVVFLHNVISVSVIVGNVTSRHALRMNANYTY